MTPETVILIKLIRKWREEGILAYFTLDAGPNIHILIEKKNEGGIVKRLKETRFIKKFIINYPCEGARIINEED